MEEDKIESREKKGKTLLIASLCISLIVSVSNVVGEITDYSVIDVDMAFALSFMWGIIGWLPIILSARYLPGFGKREKIYLFLFVLSCILYVFSIVSGWVNPIPQSV